MRVALIDPSLFSWTYDRLLALGLEEAGHHVVLHGRALRPEEGGTGGVALARDFYRVTGRAGADRLPRPLRLALKGGEHAWCMASLLARLRRERPDVIHFQWLPLPLVDRRFLPAFARIAPLVFTVHDSTSFNGSPSARLQLIGVADSLAAFDRLIVHTEGFRQRLLAQGMPAERVVRIRHGLSGQAPPRGGAGERPATLGAAAACARTFVLFGHIKPYKGIDVLIEGFARLPEALRAEARLRVVGKPYMDLAPLLELARRRGVAARLSLEPRFVAEEEIPALFGPDSIAVFPYREIEASGAVTHALAHGRPVVASRIGSFAEELKDGVHGALVPPGDPAALAAAMERLLTDPGLAARCADNVRALTDAYPSWAEIGRRTAAVYAAGIEGRRGRGAGAPEQPPPAAGALGGVGRVPAALDAEPR